MTFVRRYRWLARPCVTASFLIPSFVGVPQNSPCEVQQDTLAHVLSAIDQSNKNLRDFRAQVRQKKYFADMGEEITFLGTVAYARPKQMLWEFTSPDPSSLLIRSDGIWLIVPGMKQVQKVGSAGKEGFVERMESYFLGFEKSLSEMKRHDYQIEAQGIQDLELGRAQVIRLMHPTDPFATEIWMWFDTSRGVPLRIRWKSAQGDLTTTDFFELKINEGVDPHLFDLRVPAGYETVLSEDL